MTMTRRQFAKTVSTLAIGGALAWSLPAQAAIVSTQEAMTELVIGKADAPVEVWEYASLSCPHCKVFHDEIYPSLKRDYIDTGKIKFIYRDFPTNSAGLAAAMVARCAGPSRHAGMVDLYFDTQDKWAHADNPMQAIGMVARMAGLGSSDVDACLKNSELYDAIRTGADKAYKEQGVDATPTLFVAGKKLEHTNLTSIKEAIDAALAKKK